MFGKNKEKVHILKYVVLKNGLPNFKNDCVIEIVLNETTRCIQFKELEKNGATANLSLDKIVRFETGTKVAVLPKMLSKNKTQIIQTLKIVYISTDTEKEINLCETNNNGTTTFNLLITLLNQNISANAPKHIDL